MSLSNSEIQQLKKIIALAEGLIGKADKGGNSGKAGARSGSVGPANRRTGKDLAAFRAMLKAQRKAGVSVAELARKHGVTPSYIYQMD